MQKVRHFYCSELITAQENFNKYLKATKPEMNQDIRPYMRNAFRFELGELGQELGFFKIWRSTKQERDQEKIKVEYIDGLCFLFEIAIENGIADHLKAYPVSYVEKSSGSDSALNDAFEYLFAAKFEEPFGIIEAMGLYLTLGSMLGISQDDIRETYHAKNKINYERQQNGY